MKWLLLTALAAAGHIVNGATIQDYSQSNQYPFLSKHDRLGPASDDILYSLFESEHHPGYAMRYVRNDGFCDSPDVKSWSGYLDTDEDTHMFFVFFESRSKPKEDDVILWFTGGPGCSSSLALFMENGPCQIVEEGPVNGTAQTKVNPYSWNNNANLIFLDQPIGVGFSYADHHKHVGTTEKAAKDVDKFVRMFFETFADLKGRRFHLAGESYAGRYLPLFGVEIADGNRKAVIGGHTPVNLVSVLIGNGLVDDITTIPTYYDQACTRIKGAPNTPVLDAKTCTTMQSMVPRCTNWLKRACVDNHDPILCQQAHDWCDSQFMWPYFAAKWNPYNVNHSCPSLEVDLCYSASTRIKYLLDDAGMRKKLGVSPDFPEFVECSRDVARRFGRRADETPLIGTYYFVAALLERGVDILIYNGILDFICNSFSNAVWLDNLVWTGAEHYRASNTKPWILKNGEAAGELKSAKSAAGATLTFLRIDGAGHMVPYDQPKAALEMLQSHLVGGF